MSQPFKLYYYTPRDPDPAGVPFEAAFADLPNALADAWRTIFHGGRAVRIEENGNHLYDEKELTAIYTHEQT